MKMGKDEKRSCRREIVNFFLHESYFGRHSGTLQAIKKSVRQYELANYGRELKAYK